MKRALLLVLGLIAALLIALPPLRSFEQGPLDDAARAAAPGRFIELEHGLVHLLESGPRDGDPVVLVHGFSVPSYVWEPLEAHLAAAGFRVVRFDLYGRGFSARPDVRYDRALFARQLEQVMDRLQIERAHLVGLSMGGAIVSHFAATRPGRVQRVALLAPLTQARDIGALEWPLLGEWTSRVWFLPKLAASQMSDFVRPERHPGWGERFEPQMRYDGFGHAILSTLRHVMTEDSLGDFATLGRTSRDVLLVWGRQDSVLPFAQHAAVRAAIPQARFLPVDEAGHLAHREQPEQVAAALIAFLRGSDAAATP
jgi:pimeloyl-ACP methyl ester carboxylesterase